MKKEINPISIIVSIITSVITALAYKRLFS